MEFSTLENLLVDIENKFLTFKSRLQATLARHREKFGEARYLAIIELLKKAHDQAQFALQNPDLATAAGVPWELAHGLGMLDLLGDRVALPKSPRDCPTVVLQDGSLLGCRQWELLDYRWSEALIAWLEHVDNRADFCTTPALATINNNVVLAIAGDWGTGYFEHNAPAFGVAAAIWQAHADYTFHLGDVYYAGARSDEDIDMRDWPQGASGAFTLNSNHEMYSGALGYFADLASHFPQQQNTSYFALQNDYWLVVGLDSAYAADEWNLYMDGCLNQAQIDWLNALPKNKKVIVLSHHQAFDATGIQPTALYTQVSRALGRQPQYWYWGHLHNGICYQPRQGFYGRCVGHGAIPYGAARELKNGVAVAWFETESAADTHYPERVLNGFVKVVLSNDRIDEQFIGEDGSVRWSSTPSDQSMPLR